MNKETFKLNDLTLSSPQWIKLEKLHIETRMQMDMLAVGINPVLFTSRPCIVSRGLVRVQLNELRPTVRLLFFSPCYLILSSPMNYEKLDHTHFVLVERLIRHS